jgi:hypothetical protein
VAQLSTLGIKIGLRLELVGLAGEDLSSSIQMRKSRRVSLDLARAGFMRRASAELASWRVFGFAWFYYGFHVFAA